MQRKKIHFFITYCLLIIAMASMPFTRYLMLPIELALLLNWIVEWNWKEKCENLKNNGLYYYLWLFLAFYLLAIIGLTYSTNLRCAIADLDCKSWLVVATLIFFFSDSKFLTNKRIAYLLLIFSISTVLVMCSCLVWSTIEWQHDRQLYHFTYIWLSHFKTHPSYLAMYVTFAIITASSVLLFKPVIFQEIKPVINRSVSYSVLIIGVPFLFLLQSKAGVLIELLVLLSLLLLKLNWHKRRYLLSISLVIILLSSLVLTFSHIQLPYRFQKAWNAFSQPKDTNNAHEGTLVRISVWQTSWQLAKEYLPFGVGTGDVKQTLSDRYDKLNMDYIRDHQLNSHNQYLQTLVALGIPGLLTLLLWLVIPFGIAIHTHTPIYAFFLLIIALNMLVESMLETRAGLDFIAIMHSLLFVLLIRTKIYKNHHNEFEKSTLYS